MYNMCIKEWEMPNKITPQFKVGDIVKTLPRDDSTSYLPLYVNSMLQYAGRLATITDMSGQSCQINLDKGVHHWPFKALQLVTLEMDEPVNPHNLKNGDYIKVINLLDKWYCIYIFREIIDDKIYRHVAYFPDEKSIDINSGKCWSIGNKTEITYATEEERKLLDKALLEQGLVWNDLTKQLESVGKVNVSLTNTHSTGINVQPLNLSSIQASIQNFYDYTKLLNHTKEEPQTETELNLFPTKKHYQLNFNY